MIKVENVDVWGFDHGIRGMRNPMNSWDKSDSGYGLDGEDEDVFVIGNNDLDLMRRLYKAGSEHRKYLRQIFVSMDITAPLYWWSEFDTYKVGTTANSCSKMHKLMAKPFEMNDFSFDKLFGYKNDVKQFVPVLTEEMVAQEIWVTFSRDYEVSNYGRIKHLFKKHFRIISGSKHKDGYIFATIHGRQTPVHRIVCSAFHSDSFKEGLVVNHIDGNKYNNFADNLEWVTQKENIRHSIENNLQPKASKTYSGKFTSEERDEIKRLWDDGILSKREIAKKYGVSHTCVNDIISDKYKYVDRVNVFEDVARPLVDTLNELRDAYLICDDQEEKKKIWYSIIQLLPSSYNQRRTITMNYENVMTIINQRTGHKLDEWNEFVAVLMELPYVEEIRDE